MPNRNALENWKEEEGEREPEAEGDYLAPSEIKVPENQRNIKKVTQQHQDLSYMKPLPCLPRCSTSLPGQEMLKSPATDMENAVSGSKEEQASTAEDGEFMRGKEVDILKTSHTHMNSNIKEVIEEYLGISDQNGVSRNEEGDEYYATMMG